MICVDRVPVTAVAADEAARLKSRVFLIGSARAREAFRVGVILVDLPKSALLSSYIHSGDSIESMTCNSQLSITLLGGHKRCHRKYTEKRSLKSPRMLLAFCVVIDIWIRGERISYTSAM